MAALLSGPTRRTASAGRRAQHELAPVLERRLAELPGGDAVRGERRRGLVEEAAELGQLARPGGDATRGSEARRTATVQRGLRQRPLRARRRRAGERRRLRVGEQHDDLAALVGDAADRRGAGLRRDLERRVRGGRAVGARGPELGADRPPSPAGSRPAGQREQRQRRRGAVGRRGGAGCRTRRASRPSRAAGAPHRPRTSGTGRTRSRTSTRNGTAGRRRHRQPVVARRRAARRHAASAGRARRTRPTACGTRPSAVASAVGHEPAPTVRSTRCPVSVSRSRTPNGTTCASRSTTAALMPALRVVELARTRDRAGRRRSATSESSCTMRAT